MPLQWEKTAKQLIDLVGGPDNILRVNHCLTRVRFELIDEKKTEDALVENVEGVRGIIRRPNQYQVVMGYESREVCETLKQLLHQENVDTISHTAKNNRRTARPVIGKVQIEAPLAGTVVPLSDVPDEVFSSGMMGEGIAILPAEGIVTSPCDGTVEMVTDNGYGIGVLSEEGVNLLIHVGLNTVDLESGHFECQKKEGDFVTKGEVLIQFDPEEIQAAGCSVLTPVLVTNPEDFVLVQKTRKGTVCAGESLFVIV